MNKIIIASTILFSMFIMRVLSYGQCPGQSLTTQSQIDAFPTNFPGCSIIEGDLIIKGSDITNLNGLSSVKVVNGHLRLNDNNALTNIQGLSSLVEVNGLFTIYNNPQLVNLSGLDSLKRVGDSFSLTNNDNLETISSLTSLSEVKKFGISGCIKLQNIEGLQKLKTAREIFINNSSLITLEGLKNIINVNSFEINNNMLLKSIDGFILVDSIYGYIRISNNTELEYINGFDKLRYVSDFITITDNPKLKNFNGFNQLTKIGSSLGIARNASITNMQGLNNLEEIQSQFNLHKLENLINLSGLENLKHIGNWLWISDNDKIKNFHGLENLITVDSFLWIDNNDSLIDVNQMVNLYTINGMFLIGSNKNLRKIEGFENLKYCKSLSISNNSQLINVQGFQNLIQIESISVSDNNKLVTIKEFNRIKTLNSIFILENAKLESIKGFQKLEKIDGRFLIAECTVLADIDESFKNLKQILGVGADTKFNQYAFTISATGVSHLKNFSNLTHIGNSININQNSNLNSLVGLHNVDPGAISFISIFDNYQLNTCNINLVCNVVNKNLPVNNIYINNNKFGCSSISQIRQSCNTMFCKNFSGDLLIPGTIKCINDLLTVTGNSTGTPPITFKWSEMYGGSTYEILLTDTIELSLEIEDSKGCRFYEDTIIEPYAFPEYEINISNETCFGCNNGKISIIPQSSFEITISLDGQSYDNEINNLSPKIHSIFLRAQNGCTRKEEVLIKKYECVVSFPEIEIIEPKCFGQLGSINLLNQDKYKNITWNSGDTTFNIDRSEGEYIYILLDTFNCIVSDTIIIIAPPKMNTVIHTTHETCLDDCNGTVSINSSGGIAPYFYVLNGAFIGDSIFNNLCAGKHYVTTTDVNLCSVSDSITINPGHTIQAKITGDSLICKGDSTVISVIGKYDSLLWNTQDTTKDVSIFSSGEYFVVVSENGCTKELYKSIEYHSIMSSFIDIVEDQLVLNISGGTPPYQILWNTADTTFIIKVQNSGTYIASINDKNGCILNDSLYYVVSHNFNYQPEKTLINPTISSDYIQVINGFEDSLIQIYDMNGRVVITQHCSYGKISLSELIPGMYIFTLQGAGKNFRQKIVKI